MASRSRVKIVIPSEIRFVDLVHEAAEQMAQIVGFEERDALDFALAVREAVVNAVKHGNRLDPAEKVDIAFEEARGVLRARVLDRGGGFDPESLPDPGARGNLMQTSGRGLGIIRGLVDEVTFRFREGRGTQITLIKRHQSATRPPGTGKAGP